MTGIITKAQTLLTVYPPLSIGVDTILLLRSRRKTMSMEITRDCRVLVRAPLQCPSSVILAFVHSHESWITTHFLRASEHAKAHPDPDVLEKERLIALARKKLPDLTARYAAVMGVKAKSVKITSAQQRFGSCSSMNGICYSWRLMAYPDRAIEYVVVHELAHIRFKNHSKEFYAFVETILPDWRERAALLKL